MPSPLLEKLGDSDQLPTAPGVAMRIVELNRQEDVDINELANLLSQDPALVARVLKSANSSMFGMPRAVTSVNDAIMVLGLRSVNLIALSFSVLTASTGNADARFDYKRFWTQTLATSLAARGLADRYARPLRDEAYLAGILCDFGQLVLAERAPDLYAPVLTAWLEEGKDLCQVEREALGGTHAELASELLEGWGLPTTVCKAILGHHDPKLLDGASENEKRLAELVQLASCLGEILAGGNVESGISELQQLADSYVDLDREGCLDLLKEVGEALPEAAEALAIEAADPASLLGIQTSATEFLMRESMALNQQVSNLAERVETDALTGLRNRGFFDEALPRELASAAESGGSFGLLMIDLDHFKSVNDDYGHPIGDEMLRQAAGAIRKACESGTACRYGGEEFAVLVPGASVPELEAVAEAIRVTIEALSIDTEKGPLQRTASLGGYSVTPDASTKPTDVIEKADRQLYLAKSEGRNRAKLLS